MVTGVTIQSERLNINRKLIEDITVQLNNIIVACRQQFCWKDSV